MLACVIIVAGGVFLFLPRQARPDLVIYSPLPEASGIVKSFTRKTGIPVRLITTGQEGEHWSLALLDTAGPPVQIQHGDKPAAIFVLPEKTVFAPPTKWAELAAPAYRGMTGMADPSVSAIDYPVLAAMIESAGGWPAGKTFIETLKQNGLHIYASDAAVLSALSSGAIQIAIVRPEAIAPHTGPDGKFRTIIPTPAWSTRPMIVTAHPSGAEVGKFIAFVDASSVSKPMVIAMSGNRPAITTWFSKIIVGGSPRHK